MRMFVGCGAWLAGTVSVNSRGLSDAPLHTLRTSSSDGVGHQCLITINRVRTMNYQHNIVFLPAKTTDMCAQLDYLSRDGWEFLAWVTDFLSTEPASRMALLRRPVPTSDGNG
jgi:hypothetical protein